MPQRTKASAVDLLFGALANPTRRDILDGLLDGEQTVQAIAERFDMARPSVSEHLKVLRDCGLVTEEKQGRFRYYRLAAQPLLELRSWLDPYERYWRANLTELGKVLDEMDEETQS
ncbi:DNA-binding transcriptional ArsR family regulator [Nocardia tenerifensis]|uniref:DNA-binding transcriptional ArsR family regulator n=1 Tax=Nocardia tenerifensis TaxID=228006 RepID=A0A318KGP0_9NOCA|nr:metalloregulator ArsR/SmtB family transcription factor [Nocardia tenerifensis]PXX59270.1 DNA-binding transcriptional ArsR family regulator [Nocardia tenerifensis]